MGKKDGETKRKYRDELKVEWSGWPSQLEAMRQTARLEFRSPR